MTTPVLRLESGRTVFDLNNQVRFFLHQDFIPPAVSVTPLFASGTSANRNGAELVDRRPTNRSFSFSVNMRGASTLEMRTWLGRLQGVLNRAGNKQEPVYLAWKENSDTPEPLWGQYGSAFYYEVVFGQVNNAPGYLVGNRIATDFDLEFSLVLKPFALGNTQRAASATGRIHEDILGTSDGQSRGLVLGRNHTNKMTNPVFGASTWNTGWTADASLTASKNIYREYLLLGTTASALLTARAANQRFYQSINVGGTAQHTFLALVQRPDFGAVTSADVEIFYSTAKTSTYTDLGNGLWAVTWVGAGINAATNTGVEVKNGRSIYLLYFGAVDTDDGWFYPFWGDNLGCAWSGTAHASTSTSAAGRVRLPVDGDTVSIAQGSLRMVLKIPQSANFVNPVFWSFGATSLRAGLTLSTMTLTLTDNTNNANSAGSVVTAGQTVCLHYVWGSNGLKIYLNGVQVATNATFTLPAAPTYLYLGTDDTPTAQTENPIHDIAIWGEQLTAAQISADYDTIDELMDDRLRVAPFPWLWTKDGDDVVDNCDDSTRDNWCVVGGVAGSEAAETRLIVASSSFALSTFWLSNNPAAYFSSPSKLFYDLSNTVDANSSGGAYRASTAITTEQSIAGGAWGIDNITYMNMVAGKKITALSRLSVASGILSLRLVLSISAVPINGELVQTNAGSGFGLQKTNDLIAPSIVVQDNEYSVGLDVNGKINTGTPAQNTDYILFVAGGLLNMTSVSAATDTITIKGREIAGSTSGVILEFIPAVGDLIELEPDKYNFLVSLIGSIASNPVITRTATYSKVVITPRYTLL